MMPQLLVPEPAAQAFCRPAAELGTACPRSSAGKTKEEVRDADFILTWFTDIREADMEHETKSGSDSLKWTAQLLLDWDGGALTLTINTLSGGFVAIATEESKAHETY